MGKLEGLVRARLNSKRGGSVNRLTVRLDHERHEKLKSMADAFNLSKTASAEEILAVAVDDAYSLYVDTLEPDELYNEQTELERAINDRHIEDFEEERHSTPSVFPGAEAVKV